MSCTRIAAATAGFFAVGLLASCDRGPKPAPAIGEAYVGPHTLKLRADIPLQSKPVATVKHGERLEIVQRRRLFYKVRTAAGVEGWTDERQLLAAADMAALKDLSGQARDLPSQGQATTFADLNVHTVPARQSPSFVQIKEKEMVDVLLHRAFPREDFDRTPLLRPSTGKKAKAAKKPPKEPKIPPPPMPKPPGLPTGWLEMSRTELPPEDRPAPPVETPKAMDWWSLVRLANGSSGWVLTRRLFMAIPDEVAQYAEGRRIVSYFPLGEVEDGGQKRKHWVWTTVGDGYHDYDFDGFRVFVWNLRRHRYETAYIERNLKGWAPVLTREVEYSGGRYPGFSVCTESRTGERVRRDFAFLSNVVRSAGQKPCEVKPAAVEERRASAPLAGPKASGEAPRESFAGRLRQRIGAAFRGWFGR